MLENDYRPAPTVKKNRVMSVRRLFVLVTLIAIIIATVQKLETFQVRYFANSPIGKTLLVNVKLRGIVEILGGYDGDSFWYNIKWDGVELPINRKSISARRLGKTI